MNRFARAVTPVGISVLSAGLVFAAAACTPARSAQGAPGTVGASPAASRSAATSASASASGTKAPDDGGTPGGTSTFALFDCGGKAQFEPSDYVLTCADAGMVLESTHWVTWRPGYAVGTGTMKEKDCQPNCAEGKIIGYPVDVTLAGTVRRTPGTPFTYTTITLHYPHAAPAVYTTVNGKVTETHPPVFTMKLVNGPAK